MRYVKCDEFACANCRSMVTRFKPKPLIFSRTLSSNYEFQIYKLALKDV